VPAPCQGGDAVVNLMVPGDKSMQVVFLVVLLVPLFYAGQNRVISRQALTKVPSGCLGPWFSPCVLLLICIMPRQASPPFAPSWNLRGFQETQTSQTLGSGDSGWKVRASKGRKRQARSRGQPWHPGRHEYVPCQAGTSREGSRFHHLLGTLGAGD
jgi:hypothetical protein